MVKVINSLLPKLQIHCWGGFGSQLSTLYLILRLRKIQPGRRMKLILHTSGVTRRVNEISWNDFEIDFIQVDDFKDISRPDAGRNISQSEIIKIIFFCKNTCLILVRLLGLIKSCNDELSLASVRSWTIQIRGHYTELLFHEKLIDEMYSTLFKDFLLWHDVDTPCVIHYRLGDLMSLAQKSPISPLRVSTQLSRINLSGKSPLLLTESAPSLYKSFVAETYLLKDIDPVNLEPLTTLWLCIQADVFFGTGAKLSLWGAVFRHFKASKISYLPSELRWLPLSSNYIEWY